MSKAISLIQSPEGPAMDTALGFTFKLQPPYNSEMLKIMVNGNTTDFQENADQEEVLVRNVMFTQHTPDTKIFELNLTDKNTCAFTEDDKLINIKLMRIDPQGVYGNGFYSCELYIWEDTK